MTRRHLQTWCSVIGALLGLAGAGAIDRADWTRSLEALSPQNPLAYFELAEEIADRASSEDDRTLARELYALAAALDPGHLGRSACLALLEIEANELQRRRLAALADLLDDRSGTTGPAPTPGARPTPQAAAAASEAVALLRRGLGARALAALDTPGARTLLDQCAAILPGGVRRFEEDCKLYRHGSLRPPLSETELLDQLRLEQHLLSLAGARPRAWTTAGLRAEGAPLIEVNPDDLAAELGADASRPLYRGGEWVHALP
jgi:hypothetical protein